MASMVEIGLDGLGGVHLEGSYMGDEVILRRLIHSSVVLVMGFWVWMMSLINFVNSLMVVSDMRWFDAACISLSSSLRSAEKVVVVGGCCFPVSLEDIALGLLEWSR